MQKTTWNTNNLYLQDSTDGSGSRIRIGEILWQDYLKSSVSDLKNQEFWMIFHYICLLPYVWKVKGVHTKVGLPRWLSGRESACQCRRCRRCSFNKLGQEDSWRRKWQPSSILAWRIPWTGEAWRASVHGDTKSWTRPSDWACTHTKVISKYSVLLRKNRMKLIRRVQCVG